MYDIYMGSMYDMYICVIMLHDKMCYMLYDKMD